MLSAADKYALQICSMYVYKTKPENIRSKAGFIKFSLNVTGSICFAIFFEAFGKISELGVKFDIFVHVCELRIRTFKQEILIILQSR